MYGKEGRSLRIAFTPMMRDRRFAYGKKGTENLEISVMLLFLIMQKQSKCGRN